MTGSRESGVTIGPFLARTGRSGDITVGNAIIAAGKFNVNVEGADVEIRNFALLNAGFSYGIVGMLTLSYGFEGAWNFAQNIMQNPPRVMPGVNVDDVKLWLRRGLEKYTVPESRIITGAQNVEMDQFVSYNVNGKAAGGWTYPGEIAALPPDV